jgi:NAD-dependent dihydropyrimidine dehydrogenase PreA subunit
MLLDEGTCIACERCIPYCPMGAIHMMDGHAGIDRDECVECGVCYRSAGCPVDCFAIEELSWPRSVRRAFSDPTTEHRETRISGRGTEEMKTNEVTGRFRRGMAGMAAEIGRPGLGARFRDVELVTRALAGMGLELEPKNPLTSLLADPKSGAIRQDVLDEKVLSAIAEFVVPLERVPQVLQVLEGVAQELDSVFSLDLISRVEEDGSVPTADLMGRHGVPISPNGKVNVGLGRPLFQEAAP